MTAQSTNTTDGMATNWSAGTSLTNDRVDPKGIGLAACWSDQIMNGIRVFYPSQYGYIQEMKLTFGVDGWTEGQVMDASDSATGMGCAINNAANKQYLNFYFRNTKSGKVKQVFVEYDGTGNYFWTYDGTDMSHCIFVERS